ncbi:MAG: hypothetical protein K9N52_04340 [Verrucomicrobia bacterium]|nr:hypothetical protein [Verrucomicrobiota bacterium]
MINSIIKELKHHAPFTAFGALTGVLVFVVSIYIPKDISYNIFYILHPMHVVLSAMVTASIYRMHTCDRFCGKCIKCSCNLWMLLLIGYIGSIGIATLSDSLIPYLAEVLLDMPNREVHLGFIEKWWLVNPLAIAGVFLAYFGASTKIPHGGHVLLSTWASLFHIIMAAGESLSWMAYAMVFVFLFIAVWTPCCLSDIVFPLLFVRQNKGMSDSEGDNDSNFAA